MSNPGRAVALLRLLLLLSPRSFRERDGREILRVEEERIAEAIREGNPSEARRIVRGAAWDLVGCALGEWAEKILGRRQWGGRMEGWIRDIRHGLRSLAKSPGFTGVAALTIALGIGANTAIFSVVEAVLLRPLPYQSPDRLVVVLGEMRNRGVTDFPISPSTFLDLELGVPALEQLAGVATFRVPLTGDGEPEQVDAGGVTPNFFTTFGVTPLMGRDFVGSDATPTDATLTPGQPGFLNQMALLSYGMWQQRYGGDPGVPGRIIELGGTPTEIVGVLPQSFEMLMPPGAALATDVDIWVAMRLDYANAPRNNVFLRGVGRMAPGVTLERVNEELERVAADLREVIPLAQSSGMYFDATPLHADLTAEIRPLLVSLMGAVAFVLLIACANVGNLFLVRAASRERELAVRSALGGDRAQIFRQVLLEGGLLAGLGGALGVGLAFVGVDVLVRLDPTNLPRLDNVGLDSGVLAFSLGATVLAALLFGLIPAIQASKPDLANALKDRGRAGVRRGQRHLRNLVVIGEVALSLVLLVGAGLMVRSFAALQDVDPGFDAEGLITVPIQAGFVRYPTVESRIAFMEEVGQQLSAIPGVERAAASFPMPLDGNLSNGRWGTAEAETDPQAFRQADYQFVLPGYFETMGTDLIEGRTFSTADQADSAAVVVVDQRLAETAFPGRSAVGERILVRVAGDEATWVEIIGVVEPRRHASLVTPAAETIYYTHHYGGAFAQMTWALRTDADVAELAGAIRQAISVVDSDVPVTDIISMTQVVDTAQAPTRFALLLIGVFGAMAMILAAVGLYGVLAYAVRQRAGEFGVRMAFGAERGRILTMVVSQGVTLAAVGIAIGTAAAFALSATMESLVVGISTRDPITFVGIPLFFAVVAIAASAIPARRATLVDPAVALRE